MRVQLEVIQNELFEIGSELACFAVKKGSEFSLGLESIQRLEKEMDTYSRTLKELKNFVLPGGHLANTGGHLARCVCRRAERLILKLDEIDPVRSEIKIFINRLSDWFFIATRVVTQVSESPEIIWQLRS